MILYLDASALIKRNVVESGSDIVMEAIATAEVVGTSFISRVETVAVLAKSMRIGALTRDEAKAALQLFRSEWSDFVRVLPADFLIARADFLAWDIGLLGYDAVLLASAPIWHHSMEQEVVMGCFDRRLSRAAQELGLTTLLDEFSQ